jgi:hypothetical protein
MTAEPEIKAGQKWLTKGGDVVRILSTDADGARRVVGQAVKTGELFLYLFDGLFERDHAMNLVSPAPQTVKREVALYRWKDEPEGAERASTEPFAKDMIGPGHPRMHRISEIVAIEFTLLPGESA